MITGSRRDGRAAPTGRNIDLGRAEQEIPESIAHAEQGLVKKNTRADRWRAGHGDYAGPD